MAWPPGPVFRSLLGTLLIVYLLAVGMTLVLGTGVGMSLPLGSVQSMVWRVGFVMALLWIELHRQSTHVFLLNLSVSRRGTMGSLFLAYVVLEIFLLTAVSLAGRV